MPTSSLSGQNTSRTSYVIASVSILALRRLATFSAEEGRAPGIVSWLVSSFCVRFRMPTFAIKPTLQGVDAVDALLEATPDSPSYMIGIQENRVRRVPLVEAVKMVQHLIHVNTLF